MLPYPNQHHFGFSQEPQHPNPTASFVPMVPSAAGHLDQQHFFPGGGHAGQYFNSETLEAVLIRPPHRAASEREAAVVTAAPQAAAITRNAAVAAGHARARKRPFRTDRHSKIRTAQGVRDRRMRLSLDVARDFFALQDRLGFDKASKTVDWLLTQSKPAIDRLSAESSSHRGSGDAAEIVKEAALAAGSGGACVDKATTTRGNGASSVFMDHGCELDRLVAAAPVLGEYYYEFGEMLTANGGGEGDDDDGEYDEDGDFLDGMQY